MHPTLSRFGLLASMALASVRGGTAPALAISNRRNGTPARRTRGGGRASKWVYPRAFRAYNKRYGNGAMAQQVWKA